MHFGIIFANSSVQSRCGFNLVAAPVVCVYVCPLEYVGSCQLLLLSFAVVAPRIPILSTERSAVCHCMML